MRKLLDTFENRNVRRSCYAALGLAWLAVILAFYYASGSFTWLESGSVFICRSDCTDLHNFSTYFAEHLSIKPNEGDTHNGIFFRGFVVLVGLNKLLFGSAWEVMWTVESALAAFAVGLLFVRLWFAERWRVPALLAVFSLSVTNKELMFHGKTLLTDYLFAYVAALVFVLLAHSRGRNRRLLLFAVIIAVLSVTLRPHGVFLSGFALGFLILAYFPERFAVPLRLAFPIAGGLLIVSVAAALTAYIVPHYHDAEPGPSVERLRTSLDLLVRYNYDYDEQWMMGRLEDRSGAGIVPRENVYAMNDATFFGVAGVILRRLPWLFELSISGLADRENLHRYFYYGFAYLAGLAYCVYAFVRRKQDDRNLWLVLFYAGYALTFVAVSIITTRYKLVFDVFYIFAATVLIVDAGKRMMGHVSEQHGR